jgi:mRNA interferase MazF
MGIKQYQVYWTNLDPTLGSEIKKVRPCLVVSPNEMNQYLSTIIIAPLTSKSRNYPTRVKTTIASKPSWIVLDQLRCIDKARLYKLIATIDEKTVSKVKEVIKNMLVA